MFSINCLKWLRHVVFLKENERFMNERPKRLNHDALRLYVINIHVIFDISCKYTHMSSVLSWKWSLTVILGFATIHKIHIECQS